MSSQQPPTAREYAGEVIRHGTDAFSRYSWALAFLALAAAIITLLVEDAPTWVSVIAAILAGVSAFIAILAGGYYTWKDATAQLGQRSGLTVSVSDIRFKLSGRQGQYPAGPDVQFHLDLDVRNATEQLIRLKRLEVTAVDVGKNPLEHEYNVIERSLTRGLDASKPIVLPHAIEGGSWSTICVKIAVRHSFRSEEHLAAHLLSFGPYQIRLAYEAEDMSGHSEQRTLSAEGSLEEYAKRVALDWKARNVRKMVEIVREHSPNMLEG